MMGMPVHDIVLIRREAAAAHQPRHVASTENWPLGGGSGRRRNTIYVAEPTAAINRATTSQRPVGRCGGGAVSPDRQRSAESHSQAIRPCSMAAELNDSATHSTTPVRWPVGGIGPHVPLVRRIDRGRSARRFRRRIEHVHFRSCSGRTLVDRKTWLRTRPEPRAPAQIRSQAGTRVTKGTGAQPLTDCSPLPDSSDFRSLLRDLEMTAPVL